MSHYLGHHGDGSGIQNHSVGPWFPLVVQTRETSAPGLTPFWSCEVVDQVGNVLHAHCIGGTPTKEQRLRAHELTQSAAVRLSRFYRQARANR